MPLPDLLRALLSAHGTSGYETVPAGLWRDAASAFRRRARRRHGELVRVGRGAPARLLARCDP